MFIDSCLYYSSYFTMPRILPAILVAILVSAISITYPPSCRNKKLAYLLTVILAFLSILSILSLYTSIFDKMLYPWVDLSFLIAFLNISLYTYWLAYIFCLKIRFNVT